MLESDAHPRSELMQRSTGLRRWGSVQARILLGRITSRLTQERFDLRSIRWGPPKLPGEPEPTVGHVYVSKYLCVRAKAWREPIRTWPVIRLRIFLQRIGYGFWSADFEIRRCGCGSDMVDTRMCAHMRIGEYMCLGLSKWGPACRDCSASSLVERIATDFASIPSI